ncbi:hypothetical protein [Lysobacter capsici]|uniref:hypothetical protein n=1 Tax=Lysobacter capsici TaxID=435897 RepID=UPI00287B8702|nr:hypothetical protein [Lysobacter capsici]WND81979.1 hypothetical protein RJ610_06355 [Lysobacter capsici]WND87175.1 hypothetical protein RJ609_06360 [Lysobacter capsici]
MNLAASRAAVALSLCVLLSACERQAATPSPTPATATPSSPAITTPAQAVPTPAPTIAIEPAIQAVTDYVLPGALGPDVGPERLKQLFGAANVQISDHVPGAEGEESRGVILFADDPTRRAELHYQDQQQLRGLTYVVVRERGTRWRLDNGIGMGMRLTDLVRLNGKPIRFSGLGWDYGGTIHDWNGGKLASRDGDPVRRLAQLDYVSDQPVSGDAFPSGDRDVSSDDPRYPQQGRLLTVSVLAVSFPGEDDL